MATKLDFVLELPPELIAVVLSYLTITEVLNCLLVCKRWRETILHLVPYWTNLLQGLGVSLGDVSRDLNSFSSHKDLYLAVRSHFSVAESLQLVCSVPVCYPHYIWSSDKHQFVSKHGGGVIWRETTAGVNFLVVDSIVGGGDVVYAQRVGSVVLTGGLPVKWAHYSSNGCVYWADSSGLCRGYDIEHGKELCALSIASPAEGRTLVCELTAGRETVRTKCEGIEEYKGREVRDKGGRTKQELKEVTYQLCEEKVSAGLCEGGEVTALLCMGEEETARLREREESTACEGEEVTAHKEQKVTALCKGKKVSARLCGTEAREGEEATTQLCEGGEMMLAGCNDCSMVVCCKLESNRTVGISNIRLHVARLGEEVTTIQVTHQHSPDCRAVRGVASCQAASSTGLRLSGSGGCSMETGGMCRHHYVLLQDCYPTTTIIVAMKLVMDFTSSCATAGTVMPCCLKTWHECITCSHKVPAGASEMEPSVCGGSRLGHIHNKVLYVWGVSKELEKLQLVSKAKIAIPKPQDHSKFVLAALGEQLSIIVQKTKDMPLDNVIYIIQTVSGRVLNRVSATLAFPPSSSCCWYLLSKETQRWLSDVSAPPPPVLLTVMYSSDSAGRLAFALVRQPEGNKHLQKPHWVQAVNHDFKATL